MKCPSKILVTIVYKSVKVDIELPVDKHISDLELSIVRTLQNYMREKKIDEVTPNTVKIYHNDILLDSNKLLANYGIWDGAILEVKDE